MRLIDIDYWQAVTKDGKFVGFIKGRLNTLKPMATDMGLIVYGERIRRND